MKKIKIMLMLAAALLPAAIFGEEVNYYNTSYYYRLFNIAAGARPVGMGEAFLAVSDDVNGATWNAAGMPQLETVQAGITYDRWLVDTYFQHLTAVFPFGNMALGTNLYYFNSGSFQVRDNTGALTGDSISAYDLGGSFSIGVKAMEGTSIGLNLKFINQNIGGSSDTGMAVDLSFLIISSSNLSLAMCVKNIGWSNGYFAAIGLRGGAAVKALAGGPNSLLLALDNEIDISGLYTVCAGAEYTYDSRYTIRAGYKHLSEQSSLAGVNGLSAGAGVRLGDTCVEYAVTFNGDFGAVQRFALIYNFVKSGRKDDRKDINNAGPAAPEMPAGGADGADIGAKNDIYNMGAAYEMAGDPVKAAQKYYECLKQDPNNAPAWKNLGMIYYKAGKRDEGYRCMKKYINLQPGDTAVKEWIRKYEAFISGQ